MCRNIVVKCAWRRWNLKSLILASCNHILTVINCMSEKTYFDVLPINTEFPFKYLRIIYFVMILPSPSTIYLYSSSNEKWRQKCALQPPQQKHRNKNLSLSLFAKLLLNFPDGHLYTLWFGWNDEPEYCSEKRMRGKHEHASTEPSTLIEWNSVYGSVWFDNLWRGVFVPRCHK